MKYLHSVPFLSKILKNKLYLLLLIIFLLSAGYFIYKNYFTATQKTTYDLVRVERGDIITSISGSGQIISETQIDTKAESSGKITSIRVKAGDKVTRGEILATLDQRNALTSLRQARNSYASAKASYDKFISGISENDKKVANLSIEQAEENLNNAKQNLIDKLKIIVIDVKNDVVGTNDLFANYNTNYPSWTGDSIKTQNEFLTTQIVSQRGELNQKIQEIEIEINNLNIENIENNLQNTQNLLNKNYDYFNNLNNLMVNSSSPETSTQTKVDNYISLSSSVKTKSKNNLSSINSNLQSINSAKQNLEQSKLNFETKTEAPKSEDITIQKSSLNNSLISLQNAQNNLENTIVRAPFSGTVATVNAKVGEIGNTNIATIIADNKLAKVAFSETDAIKIKNGQKVKMTFDSIENENFEGVVDSVDVLGTVTSGVVTYNVFIKLNSKDIRIKPNMSVNADIVLNEVKDILKVETTAIKTFQEKNFVQKVNEEVAGKNLQDVELVNKPERVNVEIGQNNDEYTEIISGLNEGDIVVVKVNNPTTAKTQTNSLFNMFRPGGNTRATGTSGGAQRQGNFGAPRI